MNDGKQTEIVAADKPQTIANLERLASNPLPNITNAEEFSRRLQQEFDENPKLKCADLLSWAHRLRGTLDSVNEASVDAFELSPALHVIEAMNRLGLRYPALISSIEAELTRTESLQIKAVENFEAWFDRFAGAVRRLDYRIMSATRTILLHQIHLHLLASSDATLGEIPEKFLPAKYPDQRSHSTDTERRNNRDTKSNKVRSELRRISEDFKLFPCLRSKKPERRNLALELLFQMGTEPQKDVVMRVNECGEDEALEELARMRAEAGNLRQKPEYPFE